MSPINEINIPNVAIPRFGTNEVWLNGVPFIPRYDPPVTLQIGFPIVEIPGCVTMHKDNKDHISNLPFDKDLVNQDEKGTTTLCPHGEYPSYTAMDYQPEQLLIQRETPPPPVAPPPEIETPEIPPTGDLTSKEVPCPGPNQLRIGDLTQSGDERVIGHRLLEDGKTCETLYEPTTPLEKYVPPLNQVSTVTSLAVVATAGAAATPLLIRIIKPVIKKLWTTIQKKLGKKIVEPSRQLKQTNAYREKKGLPPLKK
tara:strand:+ start:244 stop:1008 length:765 start_codon:yes stop_codon:yes gene_type:complete